MFEKASFAGKSRFDDQEKSREIVGLELDERSSHFARFDRSKIDDLLRTRTPSSKALDLYKGKKQTLKCNNANRPIKYRRHRVSVSVRLHVWSNRTRIRRRAETPVECASSVGVTRRFAKRAK